MQRIVKPAATRQRANTVQPGGTALFGARGRRRDAYDARIAARRGSYPGAKDRRRSAYLWEKSGLGSFP